VGGKASFLCLARGDKRASAVVLMEEEGAMEVALVAVAVEGAVVALVVVAVEVAGADRGRGEGAGHATGGAF